MKTRDATFEFPEMNSEQRLAELIVYIADKCQEDPYFGAVKLNKILWFADTMSYAYHGQPITGVAYQRLPKGPAPKRLVPVKNKLISEGRIIERSTPFGSAVQKRVIPLTDPDLSVFSALDISLVDQAINFLCDKTANKASDLSHSKPWEIAKPHELIPYEAIFLSDEEITGYDISRTQELSKEFGWSDS